MSTPTIWVLCEILLCILITDDIELVPIELGAETNILGVITSVILCTEEAVELPIEDHFFEKEQRGILFNMILILQLRYNYNCGTL